MNHDENPFGVSEASRGDRALGDREASVAQVTPRTIELLNQTRPWVRLIGILMWIGTVFLGIATLAMLAGGLAGGPGKPGVFEAVACGFMALIYGVFASKLMGYGRHIHTLSQTEDVRDLEAALDAQRGFWRLSGIITVVILCLYLVVIVMAVGGAAFMGRR